MKGKIDCVIHRKWDNKIKEDIYIPLPADNDDLNYFKSEKKLKKKFLNSMRQFGILNLEKANSKIMETEDFEYRIEKESQPHLLIDTSQNFKKKKLNNDEANRSINSD